MPHICNSIWSKQVGAAGLCQELLHLTLDKTNHVRCSNWETRPLSDVQKAYAATDAYAALAVYQVTDVFIRLFAHSFIHSRIHSCIHSVIHSLVCSFVHPFIH